MDDTAFSYLTGCIAGYLVGFIMHSRSFDRAIKGAVNAWMERTEDGE